MKINRATPIVMYIMWIVTREGLSTLLMAVMLELIEDRTLPSAEINDAEEPTPFSDDGIRLVRTQKNTLLIYPQLQDCYQHHHHHDKDIVVFYQHHHNKQIRQ
jgi:hypothetical protein